MKEIFLGLVFVWRIMTVLWMRLIFTNPFECPFSDLTPGIGTTKSLRHDKIGLMVSMTSWDFPLDISKLLFWRDVKSCWYTVMTREGLSMASGDFKVTKVLLMILPKVDWNHFSWGVSGWESTVMTFNCSNCLTNFPRESSYFCLMNLILSSFLRDALVLMILSTSSSRRETFFLTSGIFPINVPIQSSSQRTVILLISRINCAVW